MCFVLLDTNSNTHNHCMLYRDKLEMEAAYMEKTEYYHKTKVHIVMMLYWILLISWQIFRSVTNRSFLDVIVKCCLMAIPIFYALSVTKRNNKYRVSSLLFLIFYFVSQIITVIINEEILSLSVIVTILFTSLSYFIYMIMLDHEQLSLKQLINLYDSFIICTVILALYNITFCWSRFSQILKISNAYGHETSSILKSNHEFALYLIFGIIMCIFCIKKKENRKSIIKYYLCILLLLINLVSTFSRTSILSLLFCLLVLIYFYNKKVLPKYILAIGLLVLFIIITPPIRTYVSEVIMKDNTDARRLILLAYGANLIRSLDPLHQLYGIGYTNFGTELYHTLQSTSLHNSYLTIMINGGILELAFYASIIISTFKTAKDCRKYDKFSGSLFLGFIVLSLLFMTTATSIIFTSQLDSYTLTMFGIIIPKYYKNYVTSTSSNVI